MDGGWDVQAQRAAGLQGQGVGKQVNRVTRLRSQLQEVVDGFSWRVHFFFRVNGIATPAIGMFSRWIRTATTPHGILAVHPRHLPPRHAFVDAMGGHWRLRRG